MRSPFPDQFDGMYDNRERLLTDMNFFPNRKTFNTFSRTLKTELRLLKFKSFAHPELHSQRLSIVSNVDQII